MRWRKVSAMQQTIDLTPLRDLRLRGHLTRRELAQAVGVDAVTVWRWERGHSIPTFTHLMALAQALAVPVTGLFLNRAQP